ncbi:BTB/POZ domain-containing protein 6-like isoform X1 [Haliotis rufescens]|uniref:BTB/POZ domain-containing protein 6-like isoform X1 n=1 Tax=Haliotis rufescens TaxID=6454 RepID=UPI00201EFB85|nr:BTB/POZ domain-containing protein 6-like isoform X1 [Haliotis rufescens]XP_048245043.1 BTB/POZ domain-containing protein 6-like isoform X1 [Haliotis rufescens]XP_048245044.1 BTB/POZ domain-containing protein 6-like isoform X1 [Haliotis rufescens]
MSGASPKSGLVDNWQGGKTVTECNLHMLNTEDFCDVTFRVGSEKQVVRAHRYVLVSRSCVFHAMFCGPLAETGEVTIPDIEADIFKEFLRYVYTDQATIDAETVTGLKYTSRKYSLDALYKLCETFLEQSLSEDNVCQILEECHCYGELDVEQKVLEILTQGGKEVIQSPGFVKLCSDCMNKFVRSDGLYLKEEDVFDAVLSWTKERCREEGWIDTPENIRRLLGDMRYEIRFTSIPLEYLVKVVGRSGVLTGDERIRIMDRTVDTTVDISPYKHSQRNTIGLKRKASCKRVEWFNAIGFSCNTGKISTEISTVSFSASRSILLLGCPLYGAFTVDAEYTLTIRVYDANNGMIDEPFVKTRMTLQGSKVLNDVLFPRFISLTAGATYTVYVDMKGVSRTATGRERNSTVTEDGVHFTFTDSPMSTTDTSTQRGQIPGLLYSLPLP